MKTNARFASLEFAYGLPSSGLKQADASADHLDRSRKPTLEARCLRSLIGFLIAALLGGTTATAQVISASDSPAVVEKPSHPNVLLICVDDLRPELNCFGATYIQSPHIDRLAAEGVRFTRHYVQAPTCGASRYTLLTGQFGGAGNGALFQRAARIKRGLNVPPSMPAWFRKHGYQTVAVGKVSHHPGGRGGRNWDDDSELEMPLSWDRCIAPGGPWKHPRGWMHGLAHGEIRVNASQMDVFQAVAGSDEIYPDGHSVPVALEQLTQLSKSKDQPFFLAVGILRPHLPFGAPAKYLASYRNAKLPPISHPEKPTGQTTWHNSGEFMRYHRWGKHPNRDADFANEVRQHYAACVSYADTQFGRILAQLEQSPAANNTIVVLWGDHGWHLGEHAIWGKHSLFEESLRSPLVIRLPRSQVQRSSQETRGRSTDQIVETLDIFPTLCSMAGLPVPETCQGQSLATFIQHAKAFPEKAAISYRGNAASIRTPRFRMTLHGNRFVELYDHDSDPGEAKNVAQKFPRQVIELTQQLESRLKRTDK